MYNFSKLNNNIYRGSAPTKNEVAKLKKNFKIDRIISLCKYDSEKIKDICNLLSIEQIIIPLDVSIKSTTIHLFEHDFDELFDKNKKIFIHCHAGKDRTGLTCAILRCKYFNWSCEDAIEEAYSFKFGKGLDQEVIDLYINIIKSFCTKKHEHYKNNEDSNDAFDIVMNQRDEYNFSNDNILPGFSYRKPTQYTSTNVPYLQPFYVTNKYLNEESYSNNNVFNNMGTGLMGGSGLTEVYNNYLPEE